MDEAFSSRGQMSHQKTGVSDPLVASTMITQKHRRTGSCQPGQQGQELEYPNFQYEENFYALDNYLVSGSFYCF